MDEETRDEDGLNPHRKDPFAAGVSRRRALRGSLLAGAVAALAGCSSESGTDGESPTGTPTPTATPTPTETPRDSATGDVGERAPTVYVSNTGDGTVSVIDADADELVVTADVGSSSSLPANQYGTTTDDDYDVLWFNVNGGVEGYDQHTLTQIADVETGFGPNYPNVTPDGQHLLVASGGSPGLDPDPEDPPNHSYTRVDADPDSQSFGEVTAEITTGYDGPCDLTIGPDGEFAFGPDIAGNQIRVLRVDPFETVATIDPGEPAGDGRTHPYMCTASFDGEVLFVENVEGQIGGGTRRGSESIWDISDPTVPEQLVKITRDDGFPGVPVSSEIAVDTEVAYVFVPGSGVVVVDIADRTIVDTLDIGGRAIAGAWGPRREKLYVPVQTANHVAVIDHAQRAVVETIDVGEAPTGAVGGMIRPVVDTASRINGALASLGIGVEKRRKTFCPGDNCYCG